MWHVYHFNCVTNQMLSVGIFSKPCSTNTNFLYKLANSIYESFIHKETHIFECQLHVLSYGRYTHRDKVVCDSSLYISDILKEIKRKMRKATGLFNKANKSKKNKVK